MDGSLFQKDVLLLHLQIMMVSSIWGMYLTLMVTCIVLLLLWQMAAWMSLKLVKMVLNILVLLIKLLALLTATFMKNLWMVSMACNQPLKMKFILNFLIFLANRMQKISSGVHSMMLI